MPHVTKIERKPKDAACAQTKVIIALQIQEVREANQRSMWMGIQKQE